MSLVRTGHEATDFDEFFSAYHINHILLEHLHCLHITTPEQFYAAFSRCSFQDFCTQLRSPNTNVYISKNEINQLINNFISYFNYDANEFAMFNTESQQLQQPLRVQSQASNSSINPFDSSTINHNDYNPLNSDTTNTTFSTSSTNTINSHNINRMNNTRNILNNLNNLNNFNNLNNLDNLDNLDNGIMDTIGDEDTGLACNDFENDIIRELKLHLAQARGKKENIENEYSNLNDRWDDISRNANDAEKAYDAITSIIDHLNTVSEQLDRSKTVFDEWRVNDYEKQKQNFPNEMEPNS